MTLDRKKLMDGCVDVQSHQAAINVQNNCVITYIFNIFKESIALLLFCGQ